MIQLLGMNTRKYEQLLELSKNNEGDVKQFYKQSRVEYSQLSKTEKLEFETFFIEKYLDERKMIINASASKDGGHSFLEAIRPTKKQMISKLTSQAKFHLRIAFIGTYY